jgi:hypothetical protein
MKLKVLLLTTLLLSAFQLSAEQEEDYQFKVVIEEHSDELRLRISCFIPYFKTRGDESFFFTKDRTGDIDKSLDKNKQEGLRLLHYFKERKLDHRNIKKPGESYWKLFEYIENVFIFAGYKCTAFEKYEKYPDDMRGARLYFFSK